MFNEEVLYAIDSIVRMDASDIMNLKKMAKLNKRRRIRLCAHKEVEEIIHEMLIVHERGCYVQPHMHKNKNESFHVIEGMADIILFDEEGRINEIIPMGDFGSGRKFYYRLPPSRYHTLFIKSEWLVFHEITKGPFKAEDTIFAPWSPDTSDEILVSQYMEMIKSAIEIKKLEGEKF